MEIKQLIITIITVYIIVSFIEWYIHRYLMHYTDNKVINAINYLFKKVYTIVHGYSQDNSHVQHHTIVKNNGDVDEDDDGMFFDIKNIPLLTVSTSLIYYFISRMFKYNHSKNEYIGIFIVLFIISCVYYKLWNILHPSYHNYHMNNYSFLKDNSIYKYLEKYHMIHHFNKGLEKTNYNIILPGADFLFGTYKGCIDNTDYCKTNKYKSKKDYRICRKQEKDRKLSGIDYCTK
jgi:TRAP-type mannitol/chloroaromatic compound transport system permease small subunit